MLGPIIVICYSTSNFLYWLLVLYLFLPHGTRDKGVQEITDSKTTMKDLSNYVLNIYNFSGEFTQCAVYSDYLKGEMSSYQLYCNV
jgi:hypothetical protein